MQKLAKKYQMVLVVPVYEVEMTGVYFNTAAVIDADGRYLGKYRKHHIPIAIRASGKSFISLPEMPATRLQTRFARVGVYICYDRHFPKARASRPQRSGNCLQPLRHCRRSLRISLGTRAARSRGSQRVFRRRHQSRWHEAPWKIGEFYGKSYFCDPRGKIVKQASRDRDECSSPS